MLRTVFPTIASLLLVLFSTPQDRAPQYTDYPVRVSNVQRNAPLVLGPKDKEFRTRLRETVKEKPNFAGHYIVGIWGCGAGCVMGAVIDAQTGKVIWLPHTTCCWDANVDDKFEPVDFRLNSSLIVFTGMRNEKEDDNGTHFYNFKNGRFIHIRSVLKEK